MSSILIIGAKGFAKELLETVLALGTYPDVVLYDEITSGSPSLLYGRFPILTSRESAKNHFQVKGGQFALGIGNPILRSKLFSEFVDLGGCPTTVISPTAQIGSFGTSAGEGTVICPGVIVTNDILIGKGCLLNLNVTIGHDSVLGDFTECSPGVHISGNVTIGYRCNIGTGAVILPKLTIGNDVTIGAGSVVTKDLEDGVTAVGVPARIIKPL